MKILLIIHLISWLLLASSYLAAVYLTDLYIKNKIIKKKGIYLGDILFCFILFIPVFNIVLYAKYIAILLECSRTEKGRTIKETFFYMLDNMKFF